MSTPAAGWRLVDTDPPRLHIDTDPHGYVLSWSRRAGLILLMHHSVLTSGAWWHPLPGPPPMVE